MKALVLVPAYNCRNTLPELLKRIENIGFFDKTLVVDDGSTDSTEQLLKEMGVRYLRHFVNRGKGAAIATGLAFFLDSAAEAVVMLDADLQHPPEAIPDILQKLDAGADFVIANRMDDTSDMPFERYFTNALSSWAISVAIGNGKIQDTQCGFKGLRRWVVERLRLTASSYCADSEMVLQAGSLGASFDSVTIPTIYNGSASHIAPVAETARVTALVVKYFVRNRILRRGAI